MIINNDEIFFLENYDRCEEALFYFGKNMYIDTPFISIFKDPRNIHDKMFGPTEKFSKEIIMILLRFLSIKYNRLKVNHNESMDPMCCVSLHKRYIHKQYKSLYELYEEYDYFIAPANFC
jgi:hypothetical protein